ncbi:hypothetical protein F2Q69_00047771 [Brassica cretica]|uniref:Uncharacterized protein n=1 Tax=Brassica cretica TaxID=69181 RepID=A0A8S9Q255_BRACR|nr:hypothetical protein F2Q69_00047771 [Brassica cretica]
MEFVDDKGEVATAGRHHHHHHRHLSHPQSLVTIAISPIPNRSLPSPPSSSLPSPIALHHHHRFSDPSSPPSRSS